MSIIFDENLGEIKNKYIRQRKKAEQNYKKKKRNRNIFLLALFIISLLLAGGTILLVAINIIPPWLGVAIYGSVIAIFIIGSEYLKHYVGNLYIPEFPDIMWLKDAVDGGEFITLIGDGYYNHHNKIFLPIQKERILDVDIIKDSAIKNIHIRLSDSDNEKIIVCLPPADYDSFYDNGGFLVLQKSFLLIK